VSAVKRAFCSSASRRSAQCAYASISSRIASRSAPSSGEIAVCSMVSFRLPRFRRLAPEEVPCRDQESDRAM
jgi:hypothetical protein